MKEDERGSRTMKTPEEGLTRGIFRAEFRVAEVNAGGTPASQ
jgi:hypothetical protein